MPISRVQKFVGFVLLGAIVSMALAWEFATPFPGYWQLGCFILIAFLLDRTALPLRIGAHGSISFVMHMASAILFGGFWGGLAAGISVGFAQTLRSSPAQKVVFNVAQRVLSVTLAVLAYRALGGSLPPAYLLPTSSSATIGAVQLDLALFFAFAIVYFGVNTWGVSTAVALSSGRRIRDVWNLNSRALLPYGIGSSVLAMVIAWVYTLSE